MRRAILLTLATLAGILLAAETFARLVVERHSKVQLMVNEEYADALRIRQGKADEPRQLLVVGSSFVGMDLDFPLLQQKLAPEWDAHRYWIYNTNYADWYYGVKELLDKGSHPDAIAVTFTILSWNAQGIRGDYSSYYLFQPSDLPALQDELHLDNTATADLLFARYSRFYGLRSEIRKVLLQAVLPDLPHMYELFRPTAGKPVTSPEVLAVIKPRLARLEKLTAKHGVRLLLIVPPMPRAHQEFQSELKETATGLHIPLIMPYSSADVPAKLFLDDVHLTPAGASDFTSAVAPILARDLNNDSALGRNQAQTPVIHRPSAVVATQRP